MNSAQKEANGLLVSLARISGLLETVESELAREMEVIEAQYAGRIDAFRAEIESIEKALKKHVSKHRADIMGGRDRIDLPNGSILVADLERVKRIKKMLAKLEAIGATGAIKTEKSVNWDEIEKWPDNALKLVGTCRVPVEQISWEIPGV